MTTATKFMVYKAETQISYRSFPARKEADRFAKEMAEYHQQLFIVKEVPGVEPSTAGRE